jgi:hypothetical protein
MNLNKIIAAAGLALVLSTAATAQTAGVQVIHNSPDPMAAIVDVYRDGILAIDDFEYLEATGVLDLPADVEIVIGIAPGDSDGPEDIIDEFPFTLTSGESYVLMAAGVLDGTLPDNPEGIDTTFNLYPKAGFREIGVGGDVDLLAYHGSPDAPTVDILAFNVGPLFTNLAFTDYSPDYISVPEGIYTLLVTPAGQNETVVAAFEADVNGLGGAAAVAFATGFLAGDPNAFGLCVALPDGTVIKLPQVDPPTPTIETSWGRIKDSYL